MTPAFARLAAASLATLLLAACGRGEDPHSLGKPSSPRAEAPSGQADRDRDGRVTREEAESDPKLAASFERYDRNSDGALDRAEFARLEAPAPAAGSDKPAEDSDGAPMRPREEYPKANP